jgi:hypothetical protein
MIRTTVTTRILVLVDPIAAEFSKKTGSNIPGGTITTGFLKTDIDEASSECQIHSVVTVSPCVLGRE